MSSTFINVEIKNNNIIFYDKCQTHYQLWGKKPNNIFNNLEHIFKCTLIFTLVDYYLYFFHAINVLLWMEMF